MGNKHNDETQQLLKQDRLASNKGMGNKHNDETQQLLKQLRDQKFKTNLKKCDTVG
jgi:hypothetical protein